MKAKTRKNLVGVVAVVLLCCDLILLALWSLQENRMDWIDVVCVYGFVNAAILFWVGWQMRKYEAGYLRCGCGGTIRPYELNGAGKVVSGRCVACFRVHDVYTVTKEGAHVHTDNCDSRACRESRASAERKSKP